MALSPAGKSCDFLCVYIKEAHTSDGWFLTRNNYHVRQHKTMKERLEMASELHKFSLPFPLLVDGLDNALSVQLRAIPERLVIILDGKLMFATDRGPIGYGVEPVRRWIEQFQDRKDCKVD